MDITKVFVICVVSGLIKLMEVLRTPMSRKGHIMIRQGNPGNYRDVLKEFKIKQYYDIIIDTDPSNVHILLREVRFSFHNI